MILIAHRGLINGPSKELENSPSSIDLAFSKGYHCEIDVWYIYDKWFCPQWFMNTLAHEMAHQYQWDIYRWEHLDYHGRPMFEGSGAHGPSFYMWRDRFDHYGLSLKRWHGQKRWFQHQDFTRC